MLTLMVYSLAALLSQPWPALTIEPHVWPRAFELLVNWTVQSAATPAQIEQQTQRPPLVLPVPDQEPTCLSLSDQLLTSPVASKTMYSPLISSSAGVSDK